MAILLNIIRITKIEDDSLDHYDVNYEGFVVIVKPNELPESHNSDDILEVASVKATTIEAATPVFESEILL